MKPFVPKAYEQVAFALLLSGIQTFIISGRSTDLTVGLMPQLPLLWVQAYFTSWVIAFQYFSC